MLIYLMLNVPVISTGAERRNLNQLVKQKQGRCRAPVTNKIQETQLVLNICNRYFRNAHLVFVRYICDFRSLSSNCNGSDIVCRCR